jgi:ADP-ribose pyrophosphatase YjhB (NUDIX family)
MTNRNPTTRFAARVLLVDEADRLLLVRVLDPVSGSSWWAAPGGGVESNETFEAAAVREIEEETGLGALVLGPCVWLREHRGEFMGQRFHVVERIFFARVSAFAPNSDRYTELERQVQTDARWWSLRELEASTEAFAPRRLVDLYKRLLKSGPPALPIDVGV